MQEIGWIEPNTVLNVEMSSGGGTDQNIQQSHADESVEIETGTETTGTTTRSQDQLKSLNEENITKSEQGTTRINEQNKTRSKVSKKTTTTTGSTQFVPFDYETAGNVFAGENLTLIPVHSLIENINTMNY
jgi:hypothetical protein